MEFYPYVSGMVDPKLYSRSDLTAFDGVDDASLHYWFREGLLSPEPAEARKHRRFNEGEAKIAALMGEARKLGLNLNALRGLSQGVRDALRFQATVVADLGNDASLERQIEAAGLVGAQHYEAMLLAWSVGDCRGTVSLHLGERDQWEVRAIGEHLRMVARCQVLLDLDRVLSHFQGAQ